MDGTEICQLSCNWKENAPTSRILCQPMMGLWISGGGRCGRAGRCLSMKSITGPWKIIGKSRGIYSCNFSTRQQVNHRCLLEDHMEKLSPPHHFHQHSEKQTWAHMLKTPKFHDDSWTIHVCAHELPWKDRFKLTTRTGTGVSATNQISISWSSG